MRNNRSSLHEQRKSTQSTTKQNSSDSLHVHRVMVKVETETIVLDLRQGGKDEQGCVCGQIYEYGTCTCMCTVNLILLRNLVLLQIFC